MHALLALSSHIMQSRLLKRYGVRLSVCLSQHRRTAANPLLLWARRARDVDGLLPQWQANAGRRRSAKLRRIKVGGSTTPTPLRELTALPILSSRI